MPSNFDYSFRVGIFAGDYTALAVADRDDTVWGLFTDARDGRLSRNQAGRNPACEQADVFLVTPCSTDIQDTGTP